MDLKSICREVINIAKNTGNFIRGERLSFNAGKVETKGLHNFVSYVDKEAERVLVDELARLLPGSGFIAEEGTGRRNQGGFNWVIDPLDGTTNFIHGLPPFSISIALMRDETTVLGVIYEVTLEECFCSWEGAQAYLNGREISVSSAGSVKDSLIATGFPYTDFHRMKPFMESFEYFMQHSHGLRRLGSAAVDLAYVACGRFDAFYEYGLNSWDVAAGAFLVRQAGGSVSDFNGGDDFIFGGEIVASNANVFGEFSGLVKKIMKDEG